MTLDDLFANKFNYLFELFSLWNQLSVHKISYKKIE